MNARELSFAQRQILEKMTRRMQRKFMRITKRENKFRSYQAKEKERVNARRESKSQSP